MLLLIEEFELANLQESTWTCHSHGRSQIPSLDAAHHCSESRASQCCRKKLQSSPILHRSRSGLRFLRCFIQWKMMQFMWIPHSSCDSSERFLRVCDYPKMSMLCFPFFHIFPFLVTIGWCKKDLQVNIRRLKGDAKSKIEDECLFQEKQRWSESKTWK